MTRHIDASKIKFTGDSFQDENNDTYISLSDVRKAIEQTPTADVVEVRHGYWEEWWDDNYLSYCHKCSECGSYPLTKEDTMRDEVLSSYCPCCGAKMDRERKEQG